MRIVRNTKSLILKAGLTASVLIAVPGAGLANSKCVESLWPPAKGAGVTRATFDRAFQGFTPDPEVIEQANYQPEYVKPVGEYIDRAVSDKRIATGKEKLVEYQDLLAALGSQQPSLEPALRSALPVVAGAHAEREQRLHAGDEVALLIPVAGGA